MDIDGIYKLLSELPKEVLDYLILNLMKDDKIKFTDLAVIHEEYIQSIKKNQSKEFMELRSKVIDLWCGYKYEIPSKLIDLMKEFKEKGWANLSQEKIDNSKWNKTKDKK